MSTAEKFEVLQAELDQALAEILKLKRQLQDQGEPLTDDKILEMADKAFGQIVDYDLHGNPITDFRVLTIGAYGPAIRRLVRLARSHADPAEVEQLRADRDDLQRYADELNDERCGFEEKIDKLHAELDEWKKRASRLNDEAERHARALAEAHALLRDALASHGVMLMTDPPQDPWKTRRIGERIREALSASGEPTSQKITTTEDSKMKDDKTDLPYVEADVNDSILSGKDWATYSIADQPPKYTHMLFEVNRDHGEARSLSELYGHYFVDGVLPKLGDEIRMVCTGRTADHLEINLKTFPKSLEDGGSMSSWTAYEEKPLSEHPGQVLTPMDDCASSLISTDKLGIYCQTIVDGQVRQRMPERLFKMHAAFEIDMLEQGDGASRLLQENGKYRDPRIQDLWVIFQARAALKCK